MKVSHDSWTGSLIFDECKIKRVVNNCAYQLFSANVLKHDIKSNCSSIFTCQ